MKDQLFEEWWNGRASHWDGVDIKAVAAKAWAGCIETILKRLPTEAPSLHALRNLVEEIESEDVATEDWPALEKAKEVLEARAALVPVPTAPAPRVTKKGKA